MEIFVLGSKGMLGKYVTTYLKDYYEVNEINSDILDATKYNEYDLITLFKKKYLFLSYLLLQQIIF